MRWELVCVVVLSEALGVLCVDELQIETKKHVDNCHVKSSNGDVLHVHYTGTLENGTEFDSSRTNSEPLAFTLGQGRVIKGWEQGLVDMCEGEIRLLTIPAKLGYGDRGAPPTIPR